MTAIGIAIGLAAVVWILAWQVGSRRREAMQELEEWVTDE